jgi:D-tyrosyl-tRNA(Tyr) deacylase
MRAVVQRVTRASVTVAEEITGQIGRGLLVFVGVAQGDAEQDAQYLAQKILGLRVFEDAEGRMNRSLPDVEGGLLVVSQFTLLADCRKGRRPSFMDAASPPEAQRLYEQFVALLRQQGIDVQCGCFRQQMDVELVNDGPVTLLLDSKKLF